MPENPGAKPSALGPAERNLEEALDHIRTALRGLRFGEISVILQDGVVVQVERTERTRLQRGARKGRLTVSAYRKSLQEKGTS